MRGDKTGDMQSWNHAGSDQNDSGLLSKHCKIKSREGFFQERIFRKGSLCDIHGTHIKTRGCLVEGKVQNQHGYH